MITQSLGVPISAKKQQVFEENLTKKTGLVSYREEPKLVSQFTALSIHREIGTPNDQLTPFLFDLNSGASLSLDSAHSELFEYHGNIGVSVSYSGHNRIGTSILGLGELVHPSFSFNSDGSLKQCVFFPISVSRILVEQEAELIILPQRKDFGSPGKNERYHLEFKNPSSWESIPENTSFFCTLIENKQIPFMTTHDLSGHIAGFKKNDWETIQALARKLRLSAEKYFSFATEFSPYSLILPFIAGFLLDSSSQPATARCRENLILALLYIIEAMDEKMIDPSEARKLTQFPISYEKLMMLVLRSVDQNLETEARKLIAEIVDEVKKYSI